MIFSQIPSTLIITECSSHKRTSCIVVHIYCLRVCYRKIPKKKKEEEKRLKKKKKLDKLVEVVSLADKPTHFHLRVDFLRIRWA